LPDVHYGNAEHFVDDEVDTRISKWCLTGTGDGTRSRFQAFRRFRT
jgi:hypothetical protein